MRFSIFMLLLIAVSSCKQRTYNSQVTNVSVVKNIATIDWACSGTGKQHPAGQNSQEEYCEWTRRPIPFSGNGRRVLDGQAVAVKLQNACVFTTSFDQTRTFFLTKNVIDQDKSQYNPFWATQFNSYAYLVGGREPDSGIERRGIIQHCMGGESCFAPNCIPDRASDPQICRTLNQLGTRGCKVDINFEAAPVISAQKVPARRHGDRVIKPQLSVRPTIAPQCWFVDDPSIGSNLVSATGQPYQAEQQRTLVACDATALGINNCDAIAPDLAAVVTLKVSNEQCLTSSQSGDTNKNSGQPLFGEVGVYCRIITGDGPANVRSENNSYSAIVTKLNPGFEVYIRGFKINDDNGVKKKWASVQFEKDGRKYGAGDGVPAFIHESQFEKQCRK
jgi:hypothetical protein